MFDSVLGRGVTPSPALAPAPSCGAAAWVCSRSRSGARPGPRQEEGLSVVQKVALPLLPPPRLHHQETEGEDPGTKDKIVQPRKSPGQAQEAEPSDEPAGVEGGVAGGVVAGWWVGWSARWAASWGHTLAFGVTRPGAPGQSPAPRTREALGARVRVMIVRCVITAEGGEGARSSSPFRTWSGPSSNGSPAANTARSRSRVDRSRSSTASTFH